jgi:RNA polymerase sigma-70 factor (ECF subfamily)
VAAKAMRSILVDHARRRRAAKRGGDRERTPLDEAAAWFEERSLDLIALDDALERLAKVDDTKARVVEHRFFAGLTIEETAEALGISHATVEREWAVARAWLFREIGGRGERGGA